MNADSNETELAPRALAIDLPLRFSSTGI